MERLINNKKYLTFILIGLLTLVIGISLSFIMFDLSGGDNSIQTGQITMTYIEPSNEVVLKDQLPISDELGKNSDKYFEFSVMSNATTNENDKTGVNIFYEISLSEKDVDQIYNQLEKNQIKVYLTKVVGEDEYEVLGPTLISDLEKSNYGDSIKLYDTKNKHHSNNGTITTKYRLRFWIDNEVDASDWYLKNKYEYRFVVNVNGHAPNLDLVNDNTLATKIKTMYTVKNGTATEENGYYYLKGAELDEDNPALRALSMYGYFGNVYLYRQEADNDNVAPMNNIRRISENEKYTFNQQLIESTYRNYLVIYGGISEAEYDKWYGAFGGYTNATLGMIAGVVTDDLQYVGGKTIEDIPTLDELMLDDNLKPQVEEMIGGMAGGILSFVPETFFELYMSNDVVNEELLNKNLELGMTTMGEADKIEIVKKNFGNISNFIIALAHEYITTDADENPVFIDEKSIADLPSINKLLIEEKNKTVTNTYVEINDILWKVMGINKDDTIKLMSVYNISMRHGQKEPYLNSEMAKLFGYNEYEKNAPFLELIKDTTLNDIIVKTNYDYWEKEENKTIKAYISMPSYEDIQQSIVNKKSYLLSRSDVTVAKIYSNSIYGIFENNGEKYNQYYEYNINPVITIKNIDVIGKGTMINPFKLEKEKTSTIEDFAFSIANIFMNVKRYYGLGFLTSNYNYLFDDDKTALTSEYDGNRYAAGVSVGNKCYYRTINDERFILDYDGDCEDNFVRIENRWNLDTTEDTYSFKETKFTVEARNAKTYKWQQKIGEEWIDLEDMTGRISGTKTNELTIIPDSYYNKQTQFRCVASNEFSFDQITMTMNLTLTDGEWVYEEIEDTNKFRITGHILEDMTLSNSLTPTGETGYNALPMYDLVLPNVINGDVIERVDSVYGKQWDYGTAYNKVYGMATFLRNVKFEEGIKVIGAYLFHTGEIKKVTLPTTLEVIEDSAFVLNPVEEINLEDAIDLKVIGNRAFYEGNISKIIIPDSVTEIGNWAFYENKPQILKLGNSLVTIGERAFYTTKEEAGGIGELVIPDTVVSIGRFSMTELDINKLTLGKNIKQIELAAFSGNGIKEIVIPYGIEYLSGFDGNPITNITIPSSVKVIGDRAFAGTDISSLTIPNSVEKIENRAFDGMRLTSIEIPDTVKEIESGAFQENYISSAKLPSNLTSIPNDMFLGNNLTSIEIPETVTSIGSYAFSENKLKTVIIPKNVKNIGYKAFEVKQGSNSSLSTITNQTGLSYNWSYIITGEKGSSFETGIVNTYYGNVTITK